MASGTILDLVHYPFKLSIIFIRCILFVRWLEAKNVGKNVMICLVIVTCIVISCNVLTENDLVTSTKSDASNRFVTSDINVPRSTIPDSCVYPATYDIEYNSSYLIRGNYAPLINISEETAVDAAFAFLGEYLPEELLTGLRVVGPGEEYFPGSPMLSTDCWPRWMMTLVSDFIEADVYVNALSGKVVKFTMSSYDTSVFEYEPIESTEEAENYTIAFLQSQNYTLLPDAVYDGVTLIDEPNNPHYNLHFHQEINGIPISIGYIYFKIDATYGLIEHFTYRWIEIDEIPLDRVLPIDDINNIVLEAVNETSENTILSTELRLNQIGFDPDLPDFEMLLVYEVTVACGGVNPKLCTIDALSGEILSIEQLIGSLFLTVYVQYLGVAAMLMVAVVSSGAAYKFVKKRQLYATIQQQE